MSPAMIGVATIRPIVILLGVFKPKASGYRVARPISLRAPGASALELSAAGERLADRHLVEELERAAHRDPARDAGHADAQRRERAPQIQGRGLALDVRIGREDHLLHTSLPDALGQPVYVQRLRPHPVQWGEPAVEYVIAPTEPSALLDDVDVARLLDHADHGLVPPRVQAVGA